MSINLNKLSFIPRHLRSYITSNSLCSTLSTCPNIYFLQIMKVENLKNYILIQKRCMAGHSKWQNIKHIKTTKDAARSILFSKLILNMKLAMKEGGGSDPKYNSQLASIIEKAKASNMPGAKIESVLKGSQEAKNLMPLAVMINGPGKSIILVDTLTDNYKRTTSDIRYILKHKTNHAFSLTDGILIEDLFSRKGLVETSQEQIDMDKALEDAIEVGAEEVTQDESDEKIIQFWCPVKDLHRVKTALQNKGYLLPQASLVYQPKYRIPVEEQGMNAIGQLIEKIEELPEVIEIYDNIQ